MNWADSYLAIPFRENGRTRAGLDCWGLYRLILLERCGIELPLYDGIPTGALRRVCRVMDRDRHGEEWLPVTGPMQPYDAVLMTGQYVGVDGIERSGIVHIGCAADSKRVIHIERDADVAVEDRNSLRLRHRIKDIRRHRSLA